MALEQYADALARFGEIDLENGWKKVRADHRKDFWPPIALLVDACSASLSHRVGALPKREKLKGRVVNGVFQPWSGCGCSWCQRQHDYHRREQAELWAARPKPLAEIEALVSP